MEDGKVLLTRARELEARIVSEAERIEADRRLPKELVRELAHLGFFRTCLPRSLGGLEVHPATQVDLFAELSRLDGSTGWCVMIGATSAVVAAYLPKDAAAEIYGKNADVVTGGVFAPRGTAVPVEGGYRVRGRWPFASGSQHCDWLMGGCAVVEGGEPKRLPSGVPESFLMLLPADEVRIHDTWRVAGLCGTGSHDIEVEDRFVPASRSLSLISDRPRESGPLYAFPIFGLLALGVCSVALGLARRAIDEFHALATQKTPTLARTRLSSRPAIQADVARAEAALGSARSFLHDAIGGAWDRAVSQGEVPLAERARLRLAATNATITSAEVVDWMYRAGGGTSIYASSPLQRVFRDVHVATQHMVVGPPTYELVGRVLLGLETDTSML